MIVATTAPVLSVAIPAHNEERTIARCIESIAMSARQAGQRVGMVVALNRCTDGTRAVAEALGARCVVDDTGCIAAVRNAAVRATVCAGRRDAGRRQMDGAQHCRSDP